MRLKDDSVHWLMFREAVIRDPHDKEATTHGIGTTRIYPIRVPPSNPQTPANLSAASAPTPLMATLFRLLAESNLAARLALLWTRSVSKAVRIVVLLVVVLAAGSERLSRRPRDEGLLSQILIAITVPHPKGLLRTCLRTLNFTWTVEATSQLHRLHRSCLVV